MKKIKVIGTALTAASVSFGLFFATQTTPANAAKTGSMTSKGLLTIYSGQKFTGDSIEVKKDRPNLVIEFTVGSIAVFEGESWELCEGVRYKAPCVIFTANSTDMGRVNIKSARKVLAAKPKP